MHKCLPIQQPIEYEIVTPLTSENIRLRRTDGRGCQGMKNINLHMFSFGDVLTVYHRPIDSHNSHYYHVVNGVEFRLYLV